MATGRGFAAAITVALVLSASACGGSTSADPYRADASALCFYRRFHLSNRPLTISCSNAGRRAASSGIVLMTNVWSRVCRLPLPLEQAAPCTWNRIGLHVQPASDPPRICQARTLFATRLNTRYPFSPKA
jgi:hypothetical protein